MKAIAAMSQNRVIGDHGRIPWHLPEDFRFFRQMTLGNVVLMGRKTFESIGKPLPGRTNIVVTRGGIRPDVVTVEDLASFDPATYEQEVFVIGGAEIYRQLLPLCTDLFLTVVRREVSGDAFFPAFEREFDLAGVVLETPDFEVRQYVNRRVFPTG